jgi:phosphate transport system protein
VTIHFLNLLDDLRRRSLRMASLVEDIVQEACDAVFQTDAALADRVLERDSDVDAAEVEVELEVVRLLALYQPVGSDLRLLCTILKVNNDLERIADCAGNMAERAKHLRHDAIAHIRAELAPMAQDVRRSLREAVQAYNTEDPSVAGRVRDADQGIDETYVQIVRLLITDASNHPDVMASHLDILAVAKNLERIADHATNIAEDVIFLSTGRIVRHRNL